MFRLTNYVRELVEPGSQRKPGTPPGPVVIWNLIRRCNLLCKHCYSISADTDFKGELNTEEALTVLDDLKSFKVPALILSGGEPLMRPDIYQLGSRAKELGIYTGLSTNGTLIDEEVVEKLKEVGFDYVGISLDGLEETHDEFRQMKGAFAASFKAVELCRAAGIKVGLRFTLTEDNAHELPELLKISKDYNIEKFYLSHLNYAGRGNKNRADDAFHITTRKALDLLMEEALKDVREGHDREFVTGNNDADGVYLYRWTLEKFPEQAAAIREHLEAWGGNASGRHIANIDNLGTVHPDTFWWNYDLGNVRDKPFSEIWSKTDDPLMAGFRQKPRPVHGRCGDCQYLKICGGNTRVRAYQLTGDAWAEDPACYLTDEEIGVESDVQRLVMTPYVHPSVVKKQEALAKQAANAEAEGK
ncbi:MAG: heme d1 biosynthesis radical SAM protein NirJ [Motiliproteus sp.]